MERSTKKQKTQSTTEDFFEKIISNIYNDLWRVIMEKHHLPNEDFECTCDDYCRYGCKYHRTGCYAY
jgi:hypothetical protein